MDLERQSKILECYGDFMEEHQDGLPDWFGGAFIDDNGEAVLLVAGDPGEVIGGSAAFEAGGYTVRYVAHSYNFLHSLKMQVMAAMENPGEQLSDGGLSERFAGCAVYEPENALHVIFENLTEDIRELFRKYVSNSSVIVLLSGSRMEEEMAVNPSDTLDSSYTMGYAAKKTGTSVNGFVTCGHIGKAKGDLIQKGSAAVAEIVELQHDETLDACFAKMRTGHTADNQIAAAPGAVITSASSSFMSGAAVVMYGGDSGAKAGRVLYPSIDFSNKKDMIVCDYKSQPGDSGSPVAIEITKNQYHVIGVHSGSGTIGAKTYKASAKAVKINTTFGLELI